MNNTAVAYPPDYESAPETAAPPSVSLQARIVEAILFAATEPMTPAQLHAALPEGADLGAALAELQAIYEGRGVQLKEIDGKWAFRTAAELGEHLSRYRKDEKKLSRAGMETLAIIAYHQPITRPEIENIRGVAISKGTIDILLELGWIKPGKHREVPGRPVTWLTTTAFLDHFGIEKIEDLPGMEELKASGLLDTRPAIEAMPDLFDADSDIAANDDADDDDDDFDDEDDDDDIEDASEAGS